LHTELIYVALSDIGTQSNAQRFKTHYHVYKGRPQTTVGKPRPHTFTQFLPYQIPTSVYVSEEVESYSLKDI